MHALVVVAHPKPESLTWSLAHEFVRGLDNARHTYHLLDLYGDRFDPLLRAHECAGWAAGEASEDVRQHHKLLAEAQGLALVYPIWWAAPPAILLGWLQRVLIRGFAFRFNEGGMRGLLRHRAQLIVNVGSRDVSQSDCYFEPILSVLRYCGIDDVKRIVNGGVSPSMDREAVRSAFQRAYDAGNSFRASAQESSQARLSPAWAHG